MKILLETKAEKKEELLAYDEHLRRVNKPHEEVLEILNEIHGVKIDNYYTEYLNNGVMWVSTAMDSKKIEVPVGIYDLVDINYRDYLIKRDLTNSQTLPLHTELSTIISTVDFSKKNNILIYGEPGNGKTQSILDLAKTNPNITFVIVQTPGSLSSLNKVKFQGEVILIFEEFTETLEESNKQDILNFLDGIDSVPNVISIMTTNYPQELEANIIDRPSRVRHFIEYKNPNEKQIDIICEHYKVDNSFFYKKNYSIDNIINVINTAKESNVSLEEAENKIKAHRKFLSKTFKGGIGL